MHHHIIAGIIFHYQGGGGTAYTTVTRTTAEIYLSRSSSLSYNALWIINQFQDFYTPSELYNK